jgi:hypothetical protein
MTDKYYGNFTRFIFMIKKWLENNERNETHSQQHETEITYLSCECFIILFRVLPNVIDK